MKKTEKLTEHPAYSLNSHAGYRQSAETLVELHGLDIGLASEENVLWNVIHARGAREAAMARSAAASFLTTGNLSGAVADITPQQQRLEEVQAKRRVVRAAIEIAEANQREQRALASIEIMAGVKPALIEKLRALAASFADLVALNEDLEKMIDALQAADIRIAATVQPISLTSKIGRIRDPHAKARYWFREHVQLGNLAREEVPAWVFGGESHD